MGELIVGCWFRAKEEHRDSLKKILQELADRSMEEDGCLQYEVFEERKNSGSFFSIQKWGSKETFGAHSKQSFLTEGFKKMETFLEEPSKIVIYNPIEA